jgi:hypothetical protein
MENAVARRRVLVRCLGKPRSCHTPAGTARGRSWQQVVGMRNVRPGPLDKQDSIAPRFGRLYRSEKQARMLSGTLHSIYQNIS